MNRDEWNRWVERKEPGNCRCELARCEFSDEAPERVYKVDCIDCSHWKEAEEIVEQAEKDR